MRFFKTAITFFLTFSAIYCNEQTCTKENIEKCEETTINQYSAELNKPKIDFSKKVEEALKNYIPCNNTKCNCHASVIASDLKVFSKGITKEMIDSVRTKGTKYQIINHKLYRDKDCYFPSRCEGVEHFLLRLVSKLKDTEFILNTRDWPQIHRHMRQPPGPVLSFSKTSDYLDIMYPAWAFWEGGPAISLYPKGLGRWDKHRASVSKSGDAFPWEKKINKAFFRGSRTSADRDPLILLSRQRPDLVDAKYTKNQAWKSDADTLHAPPASEVPLEEHCKYKYLFNYRGVAASFRLKHLFLCRSLVFHVGSQWQEFFYPSLRPWVHYIPVEADVTREQLQTLVEGARSQDDIIRQIAERGFQHMWEHLRMSDVQCYWSKLLKKYTKLLKFDPELDKDLIQIK